MNKRLLTTLSIIVLLFAITGAVAIWMSIRNRPATPAAPTPTSTPLSGFPVPAPITNPAPAATNPEEASVTLPAAESAAVPATSGILTKLSPTPISGAVLIPRVGSTTSSALIYMEENTGHLFRAKPDGQDNQQLTNSSLPGIIRIWWGIHKNILTSLAQYLDRQERPVTFRGTYDLRTVEPTELVGTIIPNVEAGTIAVSPNRDRFFSLLNNGTGVTGTVTDLSTGKVRTVFTSRLESWNVTWSSPSIITLIPRAAAGTPGTLYFLNPDNSILTRVLNGESGLTVLVNQTGDKVLYNQELGPLKLYSIRGGSTESLIITTLPEKCVWATDNITIYCAVPNSPPLTAQYPDDWWSGETTFNDSFWKVNTETNEAKIIFTNNSSGDNNNLDAVNLILDEAGERLLFTDRWTAILWSLDLR